MSTCARHVSCLIPAGSAPAAHWVYDSAPGPGELEQYVNSRNNSYLDGEGNLVIAVTTDGKGHYWSARLKTEGTFAQKGGARSATISPCPPWNRRRRGWS